MTITPASVRAKNFGLSEDDFTKMVTALKKDDKTIFEKTFLVHFKDCMLYLQRKHKASQADAYDATMDAYMLFCKRLKEGKVKYGNIRFLFTQIAVQFHFSWLKKEKKIEGLEGIDLPEELPKRYDKDTREILSLAWNELGLKCRELLSDLYYKEMTSKKLSELTGRSDVAIRKQKQRCLEKLKDLFKKFDL